MCGNEERFFEKDGSVRGIGVYSNGCSVVSGGGDFLNIGLKFGCRMYFEDFFGGG